MPPIPEEAVELGIAAMVAAVGDMSMPEVPLAMSIDSMACPTV